MLLFYLAQMTQQCGKKRRAPGQIVEFDVLVERVRTITARAEAI
jgi:hypothetical protein